MTVVILAAMLSDLPYMEVDITEHAQEWHLFYVEKFRSDKSVPFLPKKSSLRGLPT